jgi:hypothetical protein
MMKKAVMADSEVIPKYSPDGSRKKPKILVRLTSLGTENRMRDLKILFLASIHLKD